VRNADRLPPDLAARLWQMPGELMPPPWPTGGLTPAEDRAVLRTEAEALAPWRQAIEQAAPAKRAGRAAPAAGRSGGWAEAHAPVLPRTDPAAAPGAADGVSPDRATKAHAPECASDMDAAALAASLAASPGAPVATQARAHAPEPAGDVSGVSPVSARAMAGGSIQQPAGAHAPERGPAASDAAPAALLNRAARRRWKRLQRHLHRGSGTRPQPMACG
jgi:hypothetical protein